MSTVTVQNTAADPSGQPYANAWVRISLVTAVSGGAGYTSSGDIIGTASVQTDATGHWTAALVPNSQLTPANTYYQVVEGTAVSPIVVPAGGGPYNLSQILATPPPTPGAPGITGVQVAAAGTVQSTRAELNFIASGGVTITVADNPGSTRADVTISSGSSSPWQFRPATYGAFGDNTHDDTGAIITTINAAVAYAQAHNGYAEVIFDPVTYLIASAPTTGGATQGSAQIPLPVIAQTAQKVTLALIGTLDQSALPHWLQTTQQRAGTVLRSTYSAGDALPATGEVSVVGGPTPHYVNNPPTVWNNMLIVVDGIGVEVPSTVDVCGFDFRGMAEANVPNAAVLAAQTGTGAPPVPAPNWAFGLALPLTNNNDNCNVGLYSCEGMVYGLIVYEHAHVTSARLINCFDGLVCWSASGFPHRNKVEYVSIEGCTQSIVFAGSFNKMDVDVADLEWGTGHIINDAGATPALGRIGLCSNGGDGSSLSAALNSGANAVNVVNGALTLEVTNLDQKLGPVGPPAVPASGTAFKNPYWRTADVKVSGGTVTQVAIDGVNQLLTSGSFTVQPGHTITLTYSAAPAWAWNLTA